MKTWRDYLQDCLEDWEGNSIAGSLIGIVVLAYAFFF